MSAHSCGLTLTAWLCLLGPTELCHACFLLILSSPPIFDSIWNSKSQCGQALISLRSAVLSLHLALALSRSLHQVLHAFLLPRNIHAGVSCAWRRLVSFPKMLGYLHFCLAKRSTVIQGLLMPQACFQTALFRLDVSVVFEMLGILLII